MTHKHSLQQCLHIKNKPVEPFSGLQCTSNYKSEDKQSMKWELPLNNGFQEAQKKYGRGMFNAVTYKKDKEGNSE